MLTTTAAEPTSLLPATVADAGPAPAAGEQTGPHWHMPADGCDHRTYACRSCCHHGDDAD